MAPRNFEDMIRRFHADGSAVLGDTPDEISRIWEVASEPEAPIDAREINDKAHVIPHSQVRTRVVFLRKHGFEPFVRVNSSIKAIEAAHAMNQIGSDRITMKMLGTLNLIEAILK